MSLAWTEGPTDERHEHDYIEFYARTCVAKLPIQDAVLK